MSREQITSSHLSKTHALLQNLASEFVEVPLNYPESPSHRIHPDENSLAVDDDIFEDELHDSRKVVSAYRSPNPKASLLKSGDTTSRTCLPKNYGIGAISLPPLMIQYTSLSYAFWIATEDWSYGVSVGLLTLSLTQQFLLASAPVYSLLTKQPSTIRVLYEKGKVPRLPIEAGSYGIMDLLVSGFGMLSSAVLYGYAETQLVTASLDSVAFKVIFAILAVSAQLLDELEANSIATLACYLFASETARSPVFPATLAEWGSSITHYRAYACSLKTIISFITCGFFIHGITSTGSGLKDTACDGILLLVALLALAGDNYRNNRLNIKKSSLQPKSKREKVGQHVLNVALPYHLLEGITSIYLHPLSGREKCLYSIPPLKFILSFAAGILALINQQSVSINEFSLNGLLFGAALFIGMLSLLSFLRARYESAVALVSGNAYHSLLSAYWMQQLAQHPVAQPLWDLSSFSDTTNQFLIFTIGFLFLLLTTTHTRYFIDQVIVTQALLPKRKHSEVQMRSVSKSFDSPPSWRKRLFRQRSNSQQRATTFGTTVRALDFQPGNPFGSSSDEESSLNPFAAQSDEEKSTSPADNLNPFG